MNLRTKIGLIVSFVLITYSVIDTLRKHKANIEKENKRISGL